jgi:hypothetical protein
MSVPEPVIIEHDQISVVRDDLLPGGTKRRFLTEILIDQYVNFKQTEFVYPGTALGAAIIAIGHSVKEVNDLSIPVKAKIFIAKRNEMNNIMKEAFEAGGGFLEYEYVNMGFYKNVINAALKYSKTQDYIHFFQSGLRSPKAIDAIAKIGDIIKKKHGQFDAVFSACSSGTLQAGLQKAELGKKFFAVGTGMKNPEHGSAFLIEHYKLQKFEQNAKIKPPFPTFLNYDGKVWQYALQYKKENSHERVLMWNVASPQRVTP